MTKLRLRFCLSATFSFGFLCLCPAQANEVRATVTLNEGTFVFQNPPPTTGAPLSISVAGSYGSASTSASLGSVTANLDLTGKPTGADSATAGGRWTESYTINASAGSGLDGTAGNADFTFSLSGTFSAANVGASESVYYGCALPITGTPLGSGEFFSGTFAGALPPQTYIAPFSFVYGQPFDVAASLSARANLASSVGSGHVHLTLRNTGFSVAGGNYSAASATGAGRGATFATNASYAGFTLANTLAHQTTASLLDGTAAAARDVSLTFLPPAAAIPTVSDTLDVKGLAGDQVVLQMQYDEASAIAQFGSESGLLLSWLDTATGIWKNAVDGNAGGTPTHKDGAYNPLTDFVLGEWGQDTAANVVWAVINHNSEFVVTNPQPTPEPGSLVLLSLSGMALGLRRLRQVR